MTEPKPRFALLRSALLNGGYEVSRSHASAGSIKTTAPADFVHDVLRAFIAKHPVREDKIPAGSPSLSLVQKAKT
jgi:tRNA (guanine26-N2/guanine27-N2)-dimethyltransferase